MFIQKMSKIKAKLVLAVIIQIRASVRPGKNSHAQEYN